MGARVTALYRYPVKGLSAEALTRVAVSPGSPLPFDRAWAIENGPSRFDAAEPRYLPKTAFLMLMRNPRLAALEARFDEPTRTLSIRRSGKALASGSLATAHGRKAIEQFMGEYMADELRGPPKILSAEGHHFADVSKPYLHIVNAATVRELEREMGRGVDPLRFRPNLVVDGLKPWVELSWIGHKISIGTVRLAVCAPTNRCSATNVDPATGDQDVDIPAVLRRCWQHVTVGVYASVKSAGELAVGDPVEGPAPIASRKTLPERAPESNRKKLG